MKVINKVSGWILLGLISALSLASSMASAGERKRIPLEESPDTNNCSCCGVNG